MKTAFELFSKEHDKGWDKITDPLIKECQELGGIVHQVKEKFGGLRFYYSLDNAPFAEKVRVAEELAEQTCERCGEPGKFGYIGSSWMKTLCEPCREKANHAYKELRRVD